MKASTEKSNYTDMRLRICIHISISYQSGVHGIYECTHHGLKSKRHHADSNIPESLAATYDEDEAMK